MKRALVVVLGIVVVVAGVWWWKGRGKSANQAPPAASAPAGSAAAGAGSAPGAAASAPARLEGRVTGPGGGAVAGVVVQVGGGPGEPTAIAARPDGTFAFDALEPGTYVVVAGAPGHLPQRATGVEVRAGATARVDLALAAGGTVVRGTVTDASAGPIEGATVTARIRQGWSGASSATAAALTDGEGRYALSLAPGPYQIAASHPEYVGASASLEVGTAEATLDLQLVPGGALEGVVKDVATRALVPGATVIVERDRAGGWNEGRARVETKAGADGRFRVGGLVPGTLAVRAEVDDGRESPEPVVVSLGIAEQTAGLEVWVRAAPYLAGKVVDEAGAPVADAAVMAMGPTNVFTTFSEADGRFRFLGLPRGTWQLTASSKRHDAGKVIPVKLADTAVTDIVITVKAAPSVIGKVEPPGPAEVSLERDVDGAMMWGPGGLTDSARTTAGDDGRFELTPMEAGTRTVVAKAADGRRGKATVEVPATGSVEVVIRLEDRGSIAGKVSDQRGAPVPGAAVMMKRVSGGSRRTVIVNGVDQLADRARTAADGSFVQRGLEPGSYELTVVDERGGRLRFAGAAGKDRAPVTVALADGEQRRGVALTVELDDGVIRGVVKNADGTPRADAWVTAALRPDELLAAARPPGDGDNEISTQIIVTDDGSGVGGTTPVVTDDQGRFELRGLRRGVYDVAAEADRGALRGRTEQVATGTATTVTLAGLSKLTGTVTAGGAPVVDFTVEILQPPHGAGRRQRSFQDAGGRFGFERLDPGTYKVRVTSAAGDGTAEVVVEPGKDATVTVAVVASAIVRGRVVGADGKPVAGRPILSMPAIEGHGAFTVDGPPNTTDADGRFELPVEPGKRELLVLGAGSPRTGKVFEVVAGQELDLGTITLPGPKGVPAPSAPPAPAPAPPAPK